MRTRLHALLFVLLAAGALVGCGGGGDDSSGMPSDDAGSDATRTPDASSESDANVGRDGNISDAPSPWDAGSPDAAADAPPDGSLIDGATIDASWGDATSDSAVLPDASAGDAAADAPSEADSLPDVSSVPADGPTSVAQSTDSDFLCGQLTATVTIGKAVDETDIVSYALYWGTNASTKLSSTPIAVVGKTGSNVTYQLQQTAFPPTATYILAYSENQLGDSAAAASTPIVDLGASGVDISAGQAGLSGTFPSAAIDATNGKLLVVTTDDVNSPGGVPALFRCNLDGTGCVYIDISAGQPGESGWTPSALIDSANGKLLVVTTNGVNNSVPGLFRCNLDGTDCAYADISAGQPAFSGQSPSAVIDAANGKLLVVTDDVSSENTVALFRCNLDGTGCTYTDISAGQPASSGLGPSAVIDAANGKLLVVTEDEANDTKLALFRCNLDGTGCTYTDISAGQPANSGFGPSAVIDAANGKLLVAAVDQANGSKPALFRCNLDGTGCVYADISAGQPSESGLQLSAVIDAANGKLLVATPFGDVPAVFRCDLDGTDCTYIDFAGGASYSGAWSLSAAVDSTSSRILVVTGRYPAPSGNSQLTLLTSCGGDL